MTGFVKTLALLAAVTCVVWLGVLWRWEATGRATTPTDIAVYLGALPLVVFALVLGFRWAWNGAGARREAAAGAGAAAAGSAPAAAAAVPSLEAAQRHATVQLLGAHVVSATGAAIDDLLTAAAEGKPRPALSDELRDGGGLPVMCARIDGLDPDVAAAAMEPIVGSLRAHEPDTTDVDTEIGPQALRGLAALAEPLLKALHDLQPWAIRLGAPDPEHRAELVGSGGIRGVTTDAPIAAPSFAAAQLRVLAGWPEEWSAFERLAATEWLRLNILEHTEIPAERLVVTPQAGSGAELWLAADRTLQALDRGPVEGIVLLVACHSDLTQAGVTALEDRQRLFSAQQRPKGVIPGEAAAAVLLAGDNWPADPDGYLPPVRLHRPAVARRDKSVDDAGRVGSQCVQDVLTQALDAARLPAAEVRALVCDADQHTARATELFGATIALLPQLDVNEDMRLIGTVTGHTGAVDVLLLAAAAAQRARADDKPCLALGLGDPFMRLALLARPRSPDAGAVPA